MTMTYKMLGVLGAKQVTGDVDLESGVVKRAQSVSRSCCRIFKEERRYSRSLGFMYPRAGRDAVSVSVRIYREHWRVV